MREMRLLACMVLLGAILLPVQAGMSKAQEDEILKCHNDKRDEVGHSEPHLKWNSKLAEVAQEYSEKCVWGHNAARQTEAADKGYSDYVGENLYMTTGSPAMCGNNGVVDAWFAEKKDYHIDDLSCNPGKMCGHYTQVVWKKTTDVGCGMTICSELSSGHKNAAYVVCNYGPGGNYVGQAPFETARRSRLEVLLQMLLDEEQAKKVVIEMIGHETHPDESDFGRIHAQDDCEEFRCYRGPGEKPCCGSKECLEDRCQ